MNVFRGQMYNLLKAMENNLTPAHLETVSQFIESCYIFTYFVLENALLRKRTKKEEETSTT